MLPGQSSLKIKLAWFVPPKETKLLLLFSYAEESHVAVDLRWGQLTFQEPREHEWLKSTVLCVFTFPFEDVTV